MDHPWFREVNKKVVGKLMDKCHGTPIHEFVGLRSKIYSILISIGDRKMSAKSVSKIVVKKNLNHES